MSNNMRQLARIEGVFVLAALAIIWCKAGLEWALAVALFGAVVVVVVSAIASKVKEDGDGYER